MALTHWKKLDNPDYIGAYAFQPNEEKTLTIKMVRREIVTGAEGKKEECTVVHFVEPEKPLILNATNGKMITKTAGTPYIEQWTGVRIILGVERVKAFGDIVDAVRVSKKRPAPVKAEKIVCEDCGSEIAPYGKMTAAGVAEYTFKKFGAKVCMACGQARADAEKPIKEDTHDTDG